MVAPGETPELKRRSFRNFIASVRYSIDGFWAAVQHEPSFREDLIFALLLVPLAIILPVNAVSTGLMIASLILILIVELLNSAIEWVIDYLRQKNTRWQSVSKTWPALRSS
jgi:diacylglycerol kinase (ATP)